MAPAGAVVLVARLTAAPAGPLGDLLAKSEREGLRLVRRLVDEWAGGVTRFDGPGEALFVAREGEAVVGVCGLSVDPYAGRPEVGRVRHLYVMPAHRRRATGEVLVNAVITAARGRFTRLHLRTNNPAAARLYERLGFRPTPGAADHTHMLALD
ncbi:MAG TPA: GNAT family N-acetyltransferase [Methylomirabilota bacterium]|nr:GNAT family N-acetyltransferase [Methylomirabilota bacterium]